MMQGPDPATSDYWTGTTSEPMLRVLAAVAEVARSNDAVLIAGEFGTGRSALAGLIHHTGPRSHAPFFRSVLSPAQFAGRGPFAPLPLKPWFANPQLGSGGTLYIYLGDASDPEIEDVIRRVLDRAAVATGPRPEDTIQPNARLIMTVRSDVLVDGQVTLLPADLSSRLGSITLRLPPLRERLADFPELTSIFINRWNQAYGKSVQFEPPVIDLLAGYSWPGNLKQLSGVIADFLWRTKSDRIVAEDLKWGIARWKDRRRIRKIDEQLYGRSFEAFGTYLQNRL